MGAVEVAQRSTCCPDQYLVSASLFFFLIIKIDSSSVPNVLAKSGVFSSDLISFNIKFANGISAQWRCRWQAIEKASALRMRKGVANQKVKIKLFGFLPLPFYCAHQTNISRGYNMHKRSIYIYVCIVYHLGGTGMGEKRARGLHKKRIKKGML